MTRYSKGAQVERLAIDFLKRKGYNCIRSAGSKGAYDIVAYNGSVIRFIQCKHHQDQRSVSKLDLDKTFVPVLPPFVTKELWVYTKGRRWTEVHTTHAVLEYPTGASIITYD